MFGYPEWLGNPKKLGYPKFLEYSQWLDFHKWLGYSKCHKYFGYPNFSRVSQTAWKSLIRLGEKLDNSTCQVLNDLGIPKVSGILDVLSISRELGIQISRLYHIVWDSQMAWESQIAWVSQMARVLQMSVIFQMGIPNSLVIQMP